MKYITCLVKYDNIYTVHGFQINIELKKKYIFVYRRLLKINHSGKRCTVFFCLSFSSQFGFWLQPLPTQETQLVSNLWIIVLYMDWFFLKKNNLVVCFWLKNMLVWMWKKQSVLPTTIWLIRINFRSFLFIFIRWNSMVYSQIASTLLGPFSSKKEISNLNLKQNQGSSLIKTWYFLFLLCRRINNMKMSKQNSF